LIYNVNGGTDIEGLEDLEDNAVPVRYGVAINT
jgi:hypothetical protein